MMTDGINHLDLQNKYASCMGVTPASCAIRMYLSVASDDLSDLKRWVLLQYLSNESDI